MVDRRTNPTPDPPCAGPEFRGQFDPREGYCRMLGHVVPFSYCRTGTGELPCSRIADCWHERIPVDEFLRRCYPPEDLGRIRARAPGKMESILSIVKRLTDPPARR